VNQLQESIVEKIKKLLALADGNQNEHEREVAMQFAMNLLAKHNLTMNQIECDISMMSTSEVDGDFRLEPWIRRILQAACKLYYTEFYIGHRIDYIRHCQISVPVFIGSAENIAVTMDVATWLVNSVRKESNRIYKDSYERRSFRLGAADRLVERALEMVAAESRQSAAGSSNGLTVVRIQLSKANQAHLAKLNLRPLKARRSYVTPDAYADGETYGSQVGLKRHEGQSRVKAFLPDFASTP
jgi:hypothetical protein